MYVYHESDRHVILQNGWTSLMTASFFGHSAVVQVLLDDPRVEVNLKDHVSAS